MQNTEKTIQRPLSPHLQIYKWPLTMATSILHRVTGATLAVGTIMVIWLLVAAATGPDAYDIFMSHAGAWYGKLMLFGWTTALFYHMCNGVRHLFWDIGYGFKLKNAFASGLAVLFATVILTALVWFTYL